MRLNLVVGEMGGSESETQSWGGGGLVMDREGERRKRMGEGRRGVGREDSGT